MDHIWTKSFNLLRVIQVDDVVGFVIVVLISYLTHFMVELVLSIIEISLIHDEVLISLIREVITLILMD